jgi:uncharacterized protein (DUF2062 family)
MPGGKTVAGLNPLMKFLKSSADASVSKGMTIVGLFSSCFPSFPLSSAISWFAAADPV